MSEQFTFDLPSEAALGRGDFFVSAANHAAVEAVQSWHDWPESKMLLVGPAGAGKTHLAHIWAAMTGARIVAAIEVAEALPGLADGPIVAEDAQSVAGNSASEEALFHLHNLARDQGVPLMLTAQHPPARWGLGLADLASRMQGTALVQLQPPDDTLLTALLVKLFRDRQIRLDQRVLDYLLSRMERSFAAAGRLVAALDQAGLEQKRPITVPLAGQVLDKLERGAA